MTDYINHFPGTRITLNRKSYLYFGGTAYLGLQQNPDFQELYIQNLKRYGTHYGASRNANLRITIYDQAEAMLSTKTGAEAALTLSSGYLAGQLLASHFNSSEYAVFCAPGCHAALLNDGQSCYPDFPALEEALIAHLKSQDPATPVIFMDTLEDDAACFPGFEALQNLPLEQCILVADDSHGFGILGSEGTGAYSVLQALGPKALLSCFSLGKAIGIPAGAVLGPEGLVTRLKKTVRFGAASPASPAGLATLTQSWALQDTARKRLRANIERFVTGLSTTQPFDFIPGHPAYSYQEPGLSTYLKEQGIVVTHFHYPSEAEAPTSRIVITAAHEFPEIDRLVRSINAYFDRP